VVLDPIEPTTLSESRHGLRLLGVQTGEALPVAHDEVWIHRSVTHAVTGTDRFVLCKVGRGFTPLVCFAGSRRAWASNAWKLLASTREGLIAAIDRTIGRLSPETGDTAATARHDAREIVSAHVAGDTVVLRNYSDLVGLDAVDLSERWRLPAPVDEPLVFGTGDAVLLVGTRRRGRRRKEVVSLDPTTGEERSRLELKGVARTDLAPTPMAGSLVFGARDGAATLVVVS